MKKKKDKNADKISAVEETHESELELPVWSVITFDRCAASGLTYAQAAEKLETLKSEKVSGLCIVTDEVAAKLSAKKKK